MAVTILGVCCTWVIFRSPTLEHAELMFKGMFQFSKLGLRGPANSLNICSLLCLVAAGHLLASKGRGKALLAALPSPIRGVAFAIAMTITLILMPETGHVFIYFQF